MNKIITLGADALTSKNELKKIKLFNIFCLGWELLSFLMFLQSLKYDGYDFYLRASFSWFMIISLIIIQYIHAKKKYRLARILYLTFMFLLTFLFANFLFPGDLLELYYILLFSKALIFFDSKKLNLMILFTCFIAFYFPNLYLHHYPIKMFNDLSVSFLFFSIYVVISYFKYLNISSETALEKKTQELIEFNKLRTQFLGNITHEIRTPLTLIKGNLELAKEHLTDKEKALKNINTALNNSKKVVEEANQILELLKFENKQSTIKLTPVALNTTLKRIFLSFASLAELKKIKLQYNATILEDYYTKIDLQKLEKIINNLVFNAIKYSPAESDIILEATIKNQLLTIKIIDFGLGISEDEIDKIFERFYQSTKNQSVGGIGIGLSLAKDFAVLLGGSLTVSSTPRKGSIFTLQLPVQKIDAPDLQTSSDLPDEKPETPLLNEVITHTNSPKKPHILVVEDNPEMNNYLVEVLSEKYYCSTAFDGLEALEKVKTTDFDLITSDIMMPIIDGFEFRQLLNKENTYKNIPFILISAKTLEEDKIKGFQLGIDDYIVKPFNKNELIARVDNLIENKKTRKLWELKNKELLSKDVVSFNKKLIDKATQIVLDNLSNEHFKTTDLAKEVGYSSRQFSRLLKEHTGLSPVKFMLEIRLQEAYKVLQNHTFPSLAEVRYHVGIISSSYFNKKFKERFGIFPADL